ncbi:aldo/keto reductase [Pseudodesulfovibrio sediminis]|nr:aldo/keto reductase [Pseudodesulfovibrio sediminis]
MQYRKVSKNGEMLSALGYGLMRLPTDGDEIDEALAEQQVLDGLAKGINYFDTAYPYHEGKSELFIGRVIERNGIRDQIKLATKLPHWLTEDSDHMLRLLDDQLERLRTDYIDYYLIHALSGPSWEKLQAKGVQTFLDTALASGKIRNAGFSFHGATEDFSTIVDGYDWTFCQIQYNYLDTGNQAGTPGLQYAASKDMAVMIMEPLRGGNLGKTPPPSVKDIWDKAETKRTPAEWGFRWLWNQPEVTVVLSGMNNTEHIDENLRIASAAEADSLTQAEVALVEEAAAEFRRVMMVPCTGCQYCVPCPVGVNIPTCFETYNSKHTFKDPSASRFYKVFNGGILGGKPGLASQCVGCGECLKKCPQGINIPERLAEVAADMEGDDD